MGKLTTHVLDTAHGRPAAGMTISLHRSNDSAPLLTVRTNTDGRCDSPLLQGDTCVLGEYELRFVVDRYFAELGVDSPFLTTVEVRFTISDSNAHYHVPLLVSPYGYTTYRGS